MQSSGWRLMAADEELVYREPSVPGVTDTKPQWLEHRGVERSTRLDVADTDSDVVEEPAGVLLPHCAEGTRGGCRQAAMPCAVVRMG